MNRNNSYVEKVVIPKGHVWLAGDNVNNSTDSRRYGPVSSQLLRGKVILKLFPSFFKPIEFVQSTLISNESEEEGKEGTSVP
jgi:Signal peptidase, peptidase S26